MKQALARIAAVGFVCTLTASALAGTGRLIVFEDTGAIAAAFSWPVATASPPEPTIGATHPPQATDEPGETRSESTPEPSPTASPTPTTPPLATTAFRFSGRSYLGITAQEPTPTFVAPFAGTIEIRFYQLVDNEVRVGSSVQTLPFFPYIAVVSQDRRIIYRPGQLGAVTEVLAMDGAVVTAGDPLFRLITPGRSSWATFYDARVQYQVVVSLQSIPAGRDMDPSIYVGTD